MSASQEFAEYIVDVLQPVGVVTVSRMFGGALLKIDGEQLGVIFGEELYFKVVESELHEKYGKLGSKQFTYARKDKPEPVVIKNWWKVPESAMDDEKQLILLADEVMKQKR